MKYRGYDVANCNCGGPQYGTDHAPDCAMLRDAEEIDYMIELAEAEERWEKKFAAAELQTYPKE